MQQKTIFKSADGHEVKIHHVEKIADGTLVVHLRCCDDPTTDCRHTFHHAQEINGQIVHGLEQKPLLEKIQTHSAPMVAKQHATVNAATKFLQSFMDEEPAPPAAPSMICHN